MSSLYLRGNVYWLAWGPKGALRQQRSTGFRLEDREQALIEQAKFDRVLAAQQALGTRSEGIGKVGQYKRHWVADRHRRGLDCAHKDESWLAHSPELDALELKRVTPLHIRDLVRRLKGEKRLSPRSIRHAYATLHTMFADALSEGLITVNPCNHRTAELPARKDRDPAWRSQAFFTRAEVEQLLGDERIRGDRRVLYALLFLTGCRVGEIIDRRWRDIDTSKKHLGCLSVHSSFNTRRKVSKGTKTGVERQVPIHPALTKAVKQWRATGWEEMMGREPKPEDYLIPSERGTARRSGLVYRQLKLDLEELGLRGRRVHDTRRTFISLALGDGARKDILRWVTHGADGGIMDLYTSIPWAAACEAVACLRIGTSAVLQRRTRKEKR